MSSAQAIGEYAPLLEGYHGDHRLSQDQRPAKSRWRRPFCVCAIVCATIAVLFVIALWIAARAGLPCYILRLSDPFGPPSPVEPDFSNETFAVGFDLTAGYGTAAVVLWNGSYVDIGKVTGDQKYNEVLDKLSLANSQHPTPPYYSQNFCGNIPNQMKRKLRKMLGRPASEDVAALASVLSPLLEMTNNFLRTRYPGHGEVKYAGITAPHLPALYTEDEIDAAEYLGFQMIRNSDFTSGDTMHWPISQVNTAPLGMGIDLCRDWSQGELCNITGKSDGKNILSILFTDHAFSVHFGAYSGPSHEYGYAGTTRFDLGLRNEGLEGIGGETFWSSVRAMIVKEFDSYWRSTALSTLVIHGEHAEHKRLQNIVFEEVQRRGSAPEVYVEHPVFAAARGSAELTKRCMIQSRQLRWKRCIPNLHAQMPGW